MKSKHPYFFTEYEINLYEDFVRTLGIALLTQHAWSSLHERIKELTCLYGIARIVERPNLSQEEVLQSIVNLLPPAWQYPEITHAMIVLDRRVYLTPGFQEGPYKQTANIVVNGKRRGAVEVMYVEEKPELDDGPFLKEEKSLLDIIARELALIIERRQTEEDKMQIQEQLRHADRLATIGQLSAGVAHELNEPLGNILGFAQLAKKWQELPQQVVIVDVPDLPSFMRFSAPDGIGLNRTLSEVSAEYIRNALASVNGNKSRAVRILGIDLKTLREKLKKTQNSPSY